MTTQSKVKFTYKLCPFLSNFGSRSLVSGCYIHDSQVLKVCDEVVFDVAKLLESYRRVTISTDLGDIPNFVVFDGDNVFYPVRVKFQNRIALGLIQNYRKSIPLIGNFIILGKEVTI